VHETPEHATVLAMTKVFEYVRAWKFTDPHPFAQTVTSHLYKVTWNGGPAVLKLFTPIGARDEKSGAIALQCFNGHGSVRLLRHDDQAQLLEYIEGEDLKSLVKRGDDQRATLIIADVINRLHHAHAGPVPDGLQPLAVRFRSLFKRVKRDIRNSVYTKAADVANKLLSTQKQVSILHGDMHHENVKFSHVRGWVALDPKGLYGECTYDAANVLCNPAGMDDLVADKGRLINSAALLATALQLDTSRVLAFTFAHAALSASWSLEDHQDPTLALRIAAIAEPLVI
jgi:streptomycin 6-kinase